MSELTKEKLLEARGLIELGWTQGTPFDPYTQFTDDGQRAECYCLGGAIAKVLFGDPYRMYDPDASGVFEEFVSLSGIPLCKYGAPGEDDFWDMSIGPPDWAGSVYNFNDEHTKEEVLEAIDRAVSRVEQS